MTYAEHYVFTELLKEFEKELAGNQAGRAQEVLAFAWGCLKKYEDKQERRAQRLEELKIRKVPA